MKRACWRCEFYDRSLSKEELGDDEGICRRYPPSILTDDEEPRVVSIAMDAMDWCGEFKEVVE